jgi:hypothetical protein
MNGSNKAGYEELSSSGLLGSHVCGDATRLQPRVRHHDTIDAENRVERPVPPANAPPKAVSQGIATVDDFPPAAVDDPRDLRIAKTIHGGNGGHRYTVLGKWFREFEGMN